MRLNAARIKTVNKLQLHIPNPNLLTVFGIAAFKRT